MKRFISIAHSYISISIYKSCDNTICLCVCVWSAVDRCFLLASRTENREQKRRGEEGGKNYSEEFRVVAIFVSAWNNSKWDFFLSLSRTLCVRKQSHHCLWMDLRPRQPYTSNGYLVLFSSTRAHSLITLLTSLTVGRWLTEMTTTRERKQKMREDKSISESHVIS